MKLSKRTSPGRLNSATVLLTALLGTTCGGQQPGITCTTAHGSFAVRYLLQEGDGACAMLKGGILGVQSFPRGSQPVALGGKPSTGLSGEASPSNRMPRVALKPEMVGTLFAQYEQDVDEGTLFSYGDILDEEPGADGFCRVGQLSPTELVLAPVPAKGMTPALEAVDLRFEWKNVRFYVSADVIGTQFSADLTYTRNDCAATYKVTGLYPSVSCGASDPDDKTKPPEPDLSLCSPCADPAAGRSTGSGIHPDVQTSCEATSDDPADPVYLCLPSRPTPSFRGSKLVCEATK